MSIYCVSIGEREYNVQITDSHILVNGEPIKADLTPLNGNGLHIFRQGNCNREFYLKPQAQGLVEVLAEGRRLLARVDPAGRRPQRTAASPTAGNVIAPMAGLVVNVLVKAGEYVEKDQALVVLESMKMQMQLKAPCAGYIGRVAALNGAQVEKGTVLVTVSKVECER